MVGCYGGSVMGWFRRWAVEGVGGKIMVDSTCNTVLMQISDGSLPIYERVYTQYINVSHTLCVVWTYVQYLRIVQYVHT